MPRSMFMCVCVCVQRRLCEPFTLSRFTLFRMPSKPVPVPTPVAIPLPVRVPVPFPAPAPLPVLRPWPCLRLHSTRAAVPAFLRFACFQTDFNLFLLSFDLLSTFVRLRLTFVSLLPKCSVIVVATPAVAPAAAAAPAAGILVFCRLTCWSSSSSLAFCLQFALPIDKEEARRRLS